MQFIWGVGAGSASLVRHVSGWTLASISGFTSAFSRVLTRAVVSRGQERYHSPLLLAACSGIAAQALSFLLIDALMRPHWYCLFHCAPLEAGEVTVAAHLGRTVT